MDEGCIKFDCVWTEGPPVADAKIAALIAWRNRLHAAGLIGHDDACKVGFGNISQRVRPGREFVISATGTGHVPLATGREFTRVVDYDIDANKVVCCGPLLASSESLTHAAIYELDARYAAVVHVHSRKLWQALMGRLPTTGADVAYGTPAMAREFARLHVETNLPVERLAVMRGHAAGLISFGCTVEEAASRVLSQHP